MPKTFRSATLCPVRNTDHGLEVFLTRRAFWNNEKDRPMRFPGEWVLAGGVEEKIDKSLAETAVREFREELGYKGEIKNVTLLRSGETKMHNRIDYIEFYQAEIDENSIFDIADAGEVIDYSWMTPTEALEHIYSDEFTREQLTEFEKRGLGNDEFGIYAIRKRQVPAQNIFTLKLLIA